MNENIFPIAPPEQLSNDDGRAINKIDNLPFQHDITFITNALAVNAVMVTENNISVAAKVLEYAEVYARAYIGKAVQEKFDVQVNAMVDRFLSMKLPTDFSPDGGISYDERMRVSRPTGTNLFTFGQFRNILVYLLSVADPYKYATVLTTPQPKKESSIFKHIAEILESESSNISSSAKEELRKIFDPPSEVEKYMNSTPVEYEHRVSEQSPEPTSSPQTELLTFLEGLSQTAVSYAQVLYANGNTTPEVKTHLGSLLTAAIFLRNPIEKTLGMRPPK